jgi:hypothetical protein
VTPAPKPSCHKRARGEEVGGDPGRIEDVRHSPRLKFVAGDTGAEDSARPEVSADVVPHLAAAPETDSAPAEGIILVGVVPPLSSATESVTARDDAAIHTSSDPPSQEGVRGATAGATEEALVRTKSLELPEPAAQTPSSLELVSSVQDVVPAAGMRAGAAVDPPLLGPVSGSGEVSQEPFTT